MGILGCTANGHLNDSKFNEPMPYIGLYIATASAICAIFMACDLFNGIRYKKFWFPSKYFSLNATTLTLIAIAVKLSVDLNTSMPHPNDQLAKVSSNIFITTVVANSMPSIGTMQNKEMFMNIIALGILVITSIVNVCIQLATGVIYVFRKEHIFSMFLMLILLSILCSSALTVPTTKRYMDVKYKKKHGVAVKECFMQTDESVSKRLREGLMKYWMMAYTCSPQFVMGRSATCTASGAFCLLGAGTLAEAMLRYYLTRSSIEFCSGESDYKWSTTMILITQVVAVVVGTIAPASRWFTAVNFRCVKRANKALKPKFKMEEYWTRILIELKEQPLVSMMCGWRGRKFVHTLKNGILDFFIVIQIGIVFMCKLVQLISIFFMSRLIISYLNLKSCIKCDNSIAAPSNNDSGPTLDLGRFVMHLEGEEDLVDLVAQNTCSAPDHWMRMGGKQQPKHLIQFFEKYTCSQEFNGVNEFDSDKIPSLDCEESPNCWALPVVTLTSIAVALPEIESHVIKQLVRSVHEGLMYVRVVEDNLDVKKELINSRKAAESVWVGVDLYLKWFNVDLRKISLGKTPKDTLTGLSDIAKNKFMEFRKKELNGCLKETPSKWPINVMAANSVYRICQTILLDNDSRDNQSSERLFERLSVIISDILGACLTNLGYVITTKCHGSAIEAREESVRHAVLLLGKTENILKILQGRTVPGSDPNQLAYIDEWRLLCKEKGPRFMAYRRGIPINSSDMYLSVV